MRKDEVAYGMDAPAVNIWAHRGCSYRYPENTLSAFAEALRYQITGIELDIQLTRDGRMVVIHDETVDRTTDGSGSVCDMTLAELKALSIAPNPDSGLERETIPTIEEVLDLLGPACLEQGLLINIELKNSKVRYEGMEERILRLVAERGLGRNVIYSSFNADSVRLVRELESDAMTAVLAVKASECIELLEGARASAIHPLVKCIDVDDLRSRVGCPVRAWNVREHEPFFPSTDEIERLDLADLREQGVTDIITNAPELYVAPVDELLCVPAPLFVAGRGVDAETGLLAERADAAVNWEPLELFAGDVLRTKAACQLFWYEEGIDEELVRTYIYHPESNWTSYRADLSDSAFAQRDITLEGHAFVRLVFEGVTAAEAQGLYEVVRAPRALPAWPKPFKDECDRIWRSVEAMREPEDLVFATLADIHYEYGGLWADTERNVRQLARRVPLDAVIQLGDLTDGVAPAPVTKQAARRVLDGLAATGAPVYGCLGNHDANYFKKNPDRLGFAEQAQAFLGRPEPQYFVDFADKGVRAIFMQSFDQDRKERYGFGREQVRWLKHTLKSTPRGFKVIVFSHVPLLSKMHVWSDRVLNGYKVQSILTRWHNLHGNAVIAYVHGHNHADQINTELPYPVVSIGCAKFEDFEDHKPQGSTTPSRVQGEKSQELWDVLVVKPHLSSIDLFRFGAGEDRWAGLR